MTGEEILAAAQDLVLNALQRAPDGLTNAEVQDKTGLYLEVPNHTGYISWTILNHLVLAGMVVKDGRLYRLRTRSTNSRA